MKEYESIIRENHFESGESIALVQPFEITEMLVPIFKPSSMINDPNELLDLDQAMLGIFLPSAGDVFPYEDLFFSFEEAFLGYLVLEESVFLNQIQRLPPSPESAPDFLNTSMEDLLNTAVDDSAEHLETVPLDFLDAEVISVPNTLQYLALFDDGPVSVRLVDNPNELISTTASEKPIVSSQVVQTNEASIPFIGSAMHINPSMLTGSLFPSNFIQQISNFMVATNVQSQLRTNTNNGANDTNITDVLLVQSLNANISMAVHTTTTMTKDDVAILIRAGFTNDNGYLESKIGDLAIVVIDNFGNKLIVDQNTGQYIYTLNAPLHHITPDQNAFEIFKYLMIDDEGHTTSSILSIMIQDDKPIASEKDNSIQGSFQDVTGNILSDNDQAISLFGADGASKAGDSITVNGITNSSIIRVETTYGNIEVYTKSQNDYEVGDYIYTLDSQKLDAALNNATNGVVVDEISYILKDGDGSIATNYLNITIDLNVAPIVLDLDGNGIELISPSDSTISLGALSGNTNSLSVGWIVPGDGILMLDTHGDGSIAHINQISFKSYIPGARTDLQGLIAFDTNNDGKLGVGDADFSKFGVLFANGQFESLSKLNITAITLNSDNHVQNVNDNIIYGMTTYSKIINGVTTNEAVADVAFGIGSPKGSLLHTKDVIVDNGLDFSGIKSGPSALQEAHHSATTPYVVVHDSYGASGINHLVEMLNSALHIVHHE